MFLLLQAAMTEADRPATFAYHFGVTFGNVCRLTPPAQQKHDLNNNTMNNKCIYNNNKFITQ